MLIDVCLCAGRSCGREVNGEAEMTDVMYHVVCICCSMCTCSRCTMDLRGSHMHTCSLSAVLNCHTDHTTTIHACARRCESLSLGRGGSVRT